MYKYVHWDRFRSMRGSEDRKGDTFEELLENLKSTVADATKEISLDREVPAMESRLAHLLEANNAWSERWKPQTLNRKLRSELTGVNKKIEEHSRKLSQGVGNAIYADEITIWSASGQLGTLEQNLEQALDTTERFLKNTRVKLSSSKSELLLCKHGPRKGQPLRSLLVHLHSREGRSVRRCNIIKVFGIVSGAYSGDNVGALKRTEKSVLNFTRVISRLASRRDGLKEDNLMKAFHAFLISCVTYAAPSLHWKKTEVNKIDTLIRTGLKRPATSLKRNASPLC
ncbi:hypothetical protein HPB52_012925 [Rhipicephalus sanguineus]|uniref:Tick transposon n=1 Tax=Rhipicephalus sanguineus TaxID=34632 RepID=A0A9D4T2E4_RHISA|nr:hypothetical protein HPB52_012925 [Rhipicephalus sanguineus]